ncbi:MAG: GNAT family N-acetyltransferase [Lachnospiraceae bacterium]|nr:GNAT family N-acetyltransferase [Lachnospiraceae bacterium]
MKNIRKATMNDVSRIVEIVVFNYRLNFYPIFKDDDFYFNEIQVINLIDSYKEFISSMWVYDDGVVKGVIQIENQELRKIYVEPAIQGKSIGSVLLNYAINECNVKYLWALEKNTRAISFYKKHGFRVTEDKKFEEDTAEYLVRLER